MNEIIKKKIHNKNGETITETLVALLIMTMVAVVFSGSIVTAAKINARAGKMTIASDLGTGNGTDAGVQTVSNNTVTIYKCEVTKKDSSKDGSEDYTSVTKESEVKGSASIELTKEKHTAKDGSQTIEDSFYYYSIK